jgi:hypothetical protein
MNLVKEFTPMNGINIELTPTQFDYLYDVLMEAYANDVAEQKDWDVQTFDNLIDNVTNGKSTILSSDVKGIL